MPANKAGNPDDTAGHVGELNAGYQTGKTDPSTDVPENCAPAEGWTFNVTGSDQLVTGADGTVTITLSDAQLAMVETTGGETGIHVSEVQQPDVAAFGEIRCYTDILNNDNLEYIYNYPVEGGEATIYCIAYNVTTPTPTTRPRPRRRPRPRPRRPLPPRRPRRPPVATATGTTTRRAHPTRASLLSTTMVTTRIHATAGTVTGGTPWAAP